MEWTTLTADKTLVGGPGTYNIFDTTGDTYNITIGSWFFKFLVAINGLTSTTGDISLGFGGTSGIKQIIYRGTSDSHAAGSFSNVNGVRPANSFYQSSRNPSIITENFSGEAMTFQGEGIVRIQSDGTFIPQVTSNKFVTNQSKILQNSYFVIWKGSSSDSTEFVGSWS